MPIVYSHSLYYQIPDGMWSIWKWPIKLIGVKARDVISLIRLVNQKHSSQNFQISMDAGLHITE
jgi:hypothetical protein